MKRDKERCQAHLARVAALPCCLCGAAAPSLVHHVREGQFAGWGQRGHDMFTLPLCPGCHQGPEGVHFGRTMLKVNNTTETAEIAKVLRRLYGRK